MSTQAERIRVVLARLYADALSADAAKEARGILAASNDYDTDDDSINLTELLAYEKHVDAFAHLQATRHALVDTLAKEAQACRAILGMSNGDDVKGETR